MNALAFFVTVERVELTRNGRLSWHLYSYLALKNDRLCFVILARSWGRMVDFRLTSKTKGRKIVEGVLVVQTRFLHGSPQSFVHRKLLTSRS